MRKPLLPKGQRKRGRPRSKSALAAVNIEKCGKKRKQWTNEAMKVAMKSVIDENTPVSRAAKIHGVPNQHYMIVFLERYVVVINQDLNNCYHQWKRRTFQFF